MRICLDATPLSVPTGGIRRYLSELATALAREFPEDELQLLSGGVLARRWWSLGLPLELLRRGAEVFHGVDFAVPYLPVCASVMTLHDLSPWMDASWHPGRNRVRERTPALLRLGLATRILTPSQAVRRQAIERFAIPSSRIEAVPLAASALFRPVEGSPRRRPYLLYAGTLEPRKNLATLLEAWREAGPHADVDLVIAGRRRADFPAPPAAPGVEYLGAVADEELPALYSGAAAFLYPSLYEGFGLPALEAMQCGAPVIVSRDAALAEVAGEAGLRIDALDTRAWAAAMRLALENPAWRNRQRQLSIQRARQFDWARTARLTRATYERAIHEFGG